MRKQEKMKKEGERGKIWIWERIRDMRERLIPVFIVRLKGGGNLNEEFFESPRLFYFIDESRVFLQKGKNILGIFRDLLETTLFYAPATNFTYFFQVIELQIS